MTFEVSNVYKQCFWLVAGASRGMIVGQHFHTSCASLVSLSVQELHERPGGRLGIHTM